MRHQLNTDSLLRVATFVILWALASGDVATGKIQEPKLPEAPSQPDRQALIPDLPLLIERISPSVGMVLVYDSDGKQLRFGTGFLIEGQLLVTNRHVIEGGHRAILQTATGHRIEVTGVMAEDPNADLVVLGTDGQASPLPVLDLEPTPPRVGERVFVIGTPLGLEHTVADGIVSAIREYEDVGTVFQITVPISPGSSGSPVLNDKGEVIGVASFMFVEGQALNFAIPAERVARMLERILRPTDPFEIAFRESMGGKLQPQPLNEWTEEAQREEAGQYSRIDTAIHEGRYEDALRQLNEQSQGKNAQPPSWGRIALCLNSLKRYVEAIDAAQKAIALDVKDGYAHAQLGLAYHGYALLRVAEERVDEAMIGPPTEPRSPRELFRLAGISYRKAIQIAPSRAFVHHVLGLSYNDIEEWDKAVESQRTAIRLEPDLDRAHAALGFAYRKLGFYSKAVTAGEEAVRLNPTNAEYHFNLGLAYLCSENKAKAWREYGVLKELDGEKALVLFKLIAP